MCNIDKFTYNDAIITVIRSIGVVENLLQKGREVKFYIIFFPLAVLLGIALLLLLPLVVITINNLQSVVTELFLAVTFIIYQN